MFPDRRKHTKKKFVLSPAEQKEFLEIEKRSNSWLSKFKENNKGLIAIREEDNDPLSLPQVAFCSPDESGRALTRDQCNTSVFKHELPEDYEEHWCINAPITTGRLDDHRRPVISMLRLPKPSIWITMTNLIRFVNKKTKDYKMSKFKLKKTYDINSKSDFKIFEKAVTKLNVSIQYTHAVLRYAGRFPLPGGKGKEATHASHLCQNSLCIRNTHLTVESAAENESRKRCAGLIICKTCFQSIGNSCSHKTRCLNVNKIICHSCLLKSGSVVDSIPIKRKQEIHDLECHRTKIAKLMCKMK